jgi:hypothetical protein
MVGKWAVGSSTDRAYTVLLLQFKDRPPVTLLIPVEEAPKIGAALAAHSKPPARN